MSNNSNLIKGENLNMNDIKFDIIKSLPSLQGAKNIKILDKNRSWLKLIVPGFITCTGFSDFVQKDQEKGNGKYSTALMFEAAGENPSQDAFLNALKQLELKIIQEAENNCEKWFGKTQVVDGVKYLYTPMIKYPKGEDGQVDNTKNPYITVKLVKDFKKSNDLGEDMYKCTIFNEDRDLMYPNNDDLSVTPLTLLPAKRRSSIACIIQCGGIWIINKKFNVTWEILQLVYKDQILDISSSVICYIDTDKKEKIQEKEELSDGEDDDEILNINTKVATIEENIQEEPIKENIEEEQVEEEEPVEEEVSKAIKPSKKTKKVIKA